jgi:hypothetical protein
VLRLDGFVSADAGHAGGEFTTPPVRFVGDRLEVNVQTGAAGAVRVELQDVNCRPIEGFSFDDADEIAGDEVRSVVTWRRKNDVRSLADKPVRLRLVMRDAKLYSLQFTGP